jgi:hypothetical protein
MDSETIKILGAAKPPGRTFNMNAKIANRRIAALEELVGIPINERVRFVANLTRANQIIGVLQQLCIEMGIAVPARTQSDGKTGRARFAANLKIGGKPGRPNNSTTLRGKSRFKAATRIVTK